MFSVRGGFSRGTLYGLSLAAFVLTRQTGAAPADPDSAGRQWFEEKCAMCHRDGGMGSGLLSRRYPKGQEQLEARTNLSAAFVATVVRHGLNNMPAVSRAEVSDAQLASIAAYLARGNP